jgi:hypothetical protein
MVFRDMLSNSSTGNTDTPIATDTPSSALELFLDLMHREQPANVTTWSNVELAYKLCDKYTCPVVAERLRSRMDSVVNSAPWQIFAIASHANDRRLAQVAIKAFGTSGLKNLTYATLSTEAAAQLSTAYLVGIMRSMAARHPSAIGYAVDWSALSSSFAPSQ